MKLTNASSYAVTALVHLAGEEPGRMVPSHVIAADKGIPGKFLLKLLKPLVSARLLHSVKGPNGGYGLAQPPAKISLLEIIEAVDGPVRADAPFAGEGTAAFDAKLQAICNRIAEGTRATLRKVTLAELAAKGKKGK